MRVICRVCGKEFDWNSEDIFVAPSGYSVDFTCRECLKNSRKYRKDKIALDR
jgi:hypothetical protein